MTFTALARLIGIRGGIAIALGLALAFVMWRADGLSGKLDDARQLVAAEKAAHAVTRASLDVLQQRMAVFIREGEQRTKAAQEALREQQARSAALDQQIARLRAVKPTAAEIERCESTAAVMGADGL